METNTRKNCVRNCVYVYTTDYEMKDKFPDKKPIGRVIHKIMKHKYVMVSNDGAETNISVEKTPDEIAAEKLTIKNEQKIKNAIYTHKKGIPFSIPEPLPVVLPLVLSPVVPAREAKIIQVKSEIDLHLDTDTGNTTVLFGSTKRGKSTAMMYIYRKYYASKDWISLLFVSSPQAPVYKSKKLVITDAWRPDLIEAMRVINKYAGDKSVQADEGKRKHQFNFCVMIDDKINLRGDSTVNNLMMTLRNSNISSIQCLQHSPNMSRGARNNASNVLLFGNNLNNGTQEMIEVYLITWLRKNNIPWADATMVDMVSWYNDVCSDYGFIHVVPSTGTVTLVRLKI